MQANHAIVPFPRACGTKTHLSGCLDGQVSTPFYFAQPQPGCLLRVLKNENAYVTVVVNGGARQVSCELAVPSALHSTTLWGASGTARTGIEDVPLPPEATLVQLWK